MEKRMYLGLHLFLPPVAQRISSERNSCFLDNEYHPSSVCDKPLKRSKINTSHKNQEPQAHWIDDIPSPIAVLPDKPKRAWFSWFQGSARDKMDVTSADKIRFYPADYNKTTVHARGDDQPKKKAITFAKASEPWGQFPKKSRNVKSYPRSTNIPDSSRKTQENVRDKTCLESQFIKFSPRKMFN